VEKKDTAEIESRMKRRESEVAGIPRARQSSRGNDWDEWMEGLADHNFITSHVSDVEMRKNSGSDIFFPLLLSFSPSLPQSLSRSRGNIGNYVSRPILNRCLTWKVNPFPLYRTFPHRFPLTWFFSIEIFAPLPKAVTHQLLSFKYFLKKDNL